MVNYMNSMLLFLLFQNFSCSFLRCSFISALHAERLSGNPVSAYMGIHKLPELRSLTRISCNSFRKSVCALFFFSRVRTLIVFLSKYNWIEMSLLIACESWIGSGGYRSPPMVLCTTACGKDSLANVSCLRHLTHSHKRELEHSFHVI